MMYGLAILAFLSVVNALPPGNDTLIFVAKDWKQADLPPGFPFPPSKYVYSGVELILNCTTNDPDAEVSLTEKSDGGSYENSEATKKERISRNGQTFVVDPTKKEDAKEYQCTARNDRDGEKFLILGTLNVNRISSDVPEIFPFQKKLLIEQNGSYEIHCKTLGNLGTSLKLIEWYRETLDGNRTMLDGVHADEGPSHSNIDIVTYSFNNFQKTDAGTYICVKTLTTDTKVYVTENKIVVDLEDPVAPNVTFPDFTSSQPVHSVNVSNNIVIYCSISGSPKPKRYWMKGSNQIKECVEEGHCVLTVPSAKHPGDSGVYTCVGENLVSTTKKDITVVVQVPVELKKPTVTYTATYNEDKKLICEVSKGNPAPKVAWEYQVDTCNTKDCAALPDKWLSVEQQSPDKDTLTMKSTTVSKKSKINYFYRCIAKNNISNDTYEFQLMRTTEKVVVFDFEALSNPINEEDQLKIVCSVDNNQFKSAVIIKVGQTDALRTNEDIDSVTKITKNIYIKPVSELGDQGEYLCQATRARGGLENKTLTIVVNKLQAPVIHGFDNMTVNQDTKRKLRVFCNVSGNPHPKVTWTHNENVVVAQHTIDDINRCSSMVSGIYLKTGQDDTLIICDLNFQEHSGLYECSAKNKVDVVTETIHLTIEASPKILEWNDKIIFGLKDPVNITCQAPANPPANITWEKIEGNGSIVVITRASYLRFDELTKEDAGQYRCTAENKFKAVSAYVELAVKGSTQAARSSGNSKATIIGIIIAFVIVLIIILILVLLYQRRLKKRYALYLEPNDDFKLDMDRTLFEQSSELPYDTAWEFPREKLTFLKTLGSGAFGQVWLAEAEGIHAFKPRDTTIDARRRRKSIQKNRRYVRMSFRYKKTTQTAEMSLEKSMVAVKTLKEEAAEGEYKDLASELKILIHLGEHKNIVNLLGACTTGGRLCVILECCPHGSLLTFLRSRRDSFDPVWKKHQTDMEKEFTYIDMLMIAYQVSKGMDFLQSRKCIHRDLAARNVLVGDDYIMKIADFGLARDIYKDEVYMKQTTGLLPVKWMAPESLFDKLYTSSSDVWSFGILLWEIFTLGGSPYPGLPTEELFSFLEDDKRMDCPEKCPKDVYGIMYDCWTKSPYERPLFSQLVERLNNVMKQNVSQGGGNEYLDFCDSVAQDNYLTPEENNTKLKHGVSSEYLEATAPDTTHPKGDSHVPLLTEVIDDDDENELSADSALPPTPNDEHYKVPVSIRQPPF